VAGALAVAGCAGHESSGASIPTLPVAFTTARDTTDDIDSPAVWHGPEGQHWLLATAKATDVIVVADAADGSLIQRFGGEGRGTGQLDRPNGIAVTDDLLWVVERDNRRVQVFKLPSFHSLGTFGDAELSKPYGIAISHEIDGSYSLWITDNYEFQENVIPPDSLLGERIRQYEVAIGNDALDARLVGTFGETSGPGVLHVVESVAVDRALGRLAIAEEREEDSAIKVYDLDGRFANEVIGPGFFPNQAEGIALYACLDGSGYWITTDQGKTENTFHLFDRATLEHVGSFRVEGVLNTDGVAITQRGFGAFPSGAFFAVHDDGSVAAVSWQSIASALDLRSDCSEE
jgi:3-phytase